LAHWISRARQLGAEYVATGHFARVEKSADGGRMLLKRRSRPTQGPELFFFIEAAAIGAVPVFRWAK